MSLIIQKYGGSSIANIDGIRRVAQRVFGTRKRGNSIVVVVSAMGKTTDQLINLAHQVSSSPSDRELDMLMSTGEQVSVALLAMALHGMGVDAVSLTGPQAGISTDAIHRHAKIMNIDPRRIFRHLKEERVVIVAGFQGLTPLADVATLGRGGSDTTAVALAVALKAERCQIFTDVEGVYSADPRIVKDARKLDEIAYDEMLELASLGAKVLMGRSVEYAKKYEVKLEVLSSFTKTPGTIVQKEVKKMEDIVVRGVSADTNQARVLLSGVPDKPGVAAKLFKELAGANLNIDMIIQNSSSNGTADISFTVSDEDFPKIRKVIHASAKKVGFQAIRVDGDIAKISVVGVGMRGHSGVAFLMFKTLAENHINIIMISTSEIKISVVIQKRYANKALRALHKVFALSKKRVLSRKSTKSSLRGACGKDNMAGSVKTGKREKIK